ncbi:MAG: VWA domain-containing protein, partial [Acidobacteriaceae bacterium]|nr:VWA domain-containing protein [Acidobacteriaceae bacterium]
MSFGRFDTSFRVAPGPTCRKRRGSFTIEDVMKSLTTAAISLLMLLAQANAPVFAQQGSTQSGSQQSGSQQPSAQQQSGQDDAAPEAGGPTGDNGSIALPKKKEPAESAPPPAEEPKVKNPPGLQNFSLHVDVPVVTVDVGVLLEKTHQFVPNLKQENFRIYEDGKEQQITSFQQIKAPITAVLLVEFASTSYYFVYDMRNAAYTFAEQLRPDDYIAVMTYDMHTNILSDFTQDKRVVYNALNSLTIPTWRETNMFDALYTTLDRLSR